YLMERCEDYNRISIQNPESRIQNSQVSPLKPCLEAELLSSYNNFLFRQEREAPRGGGTTQRWPRPGLACNGWRGQSAAMAPSGLACNGWRGQSAAMAPSGPPVEDADCRAFACAQTRPPAVHAIAVRATGSSCHARSCKVDSEH